MNFRKPTSILAAVLSVALLFAGCGKMTPSKLAEKTTAALLSKPATSLKATFDLDISMGAMGLSTDLKMNGSANAKFSTDPLKTYTETELNMKMLGIDYSQVSQTYTRVEDGKYVSYTHENNYGKWERQEMEGIKLPSQSVVLEIFKKKSESDFVLADKTQQLDGRDVYVLSFTITGEELRSVAENSIELEKDLDNVDLSVVSVPVIFYIDKETFLPAKSEMEFVGMNDMISQILEKSLDTNLEQMKMDLKINTIKVVCTDFGYEPAEIPEVPQEALTSSIDKD